MQLSLQLLLLHVLMPFRALRIGWCFTAYDTVVPLVHAVVIRFCSCQRPAAVTTVVGFCAVIAARAVALLYKSLLVPVLLLLHALLHLLMFLLRMLLLMQLLLQVLSISRLQLSFAADTASVVALSAVAIAHGVAIGYTAVHTCWRRWYGCCYCHMCSCPVAVAAAPIAFASAVATMCAGAAAPFAAFGVIAVACIVAAACAVAYACTAAVG